jgi:hypothetical protein
MLYNSIISAYRALRQRMSPAAARQTLRHAHIYSNGNVYLGN